MIDARPQSYFAYNSMGGFYYRRSQYDKAVRLFQKVRSWLPFIGYLN